MVVQFAGRPGAHQLAVAHHADAIGDFHHFIQPVADEYHADAGRLQLVDHPQQAVDLLAGQRGGRFVHDNQPSLGGDGAANRHQLPIGDRQFFHLLSGSMRMPTRAMASSAVWRITRLRTQKRPPGR